MNIKCIDLFCGAGGLTKGFESLGLNVVAGFDFDPACEHPYSQNNEANFVFKTSRKSQQRSFFVLLERLTLKFWQVVRPVSLFPLIRNVTKL